MQTSVWLSTPYSTTARFIAGKCLATYAPAVARPGHRLPPPLACQRQQRGLPI